MARRALGDDDGEAAPLLGGAPADSAAAASPPPPLPRPVAAGPAAVGRLTAAAAAAASLAARPKSKLATVSGFDHHAPRALRAASGTSASSAFGPPPAPGLLGRALGLWNSGIACAAAAYVIFSVSGFCVKLTQGEGQQGEGQRVRGAGRVAPAPSPPLHPPPRTPLTTRPQGACRCWSCASSAAACRSQ
jgi:hypothetical protein